MRSDPLDALLEQATSAHRDLDASGALIPSAAWMDLDEAGRERLFRRQTAARRLEAALDADGLNTTCRAVVERAARLGQLR